MRVYEKPPVGFEPTTASIRGDARRIVAPIGEATTAAPQIRPQTPEQTPKRTSDVQPNDNRPAHRFNQHRNGQPSLTHRVYLALAGGPITAGAVAKLLNVPTDDVSQVLWRLKHWGLASREDRRPTTDACDISRRFYWSRA